MTHNNSLQLGYVGLIKMKEIFPDVWKRQTDWFMTIHGRVFRKLQLIIKLRYN